MNRRVFLKNLGYAILSTSSISYSAENISFSKINKKDEFMNWTWLHTNLKKTDQEWQRIFSDWRSAGIHAILPNIYDSRWAYFASQFLPVRGNWLERIIPIAKNIGLEIHGWMWCMPCNVEQIVNTHPEWFCVDRSGESASSHPAYVSYYKFMCPNREEVQEFLQKIIAEIAQFDELDGIHFDYIRFPDVILPKALQPKYQIVQDREYPEYDYCYCEVCRHKFQDEYGTDPLKLDDPSRCKEWIQFRYDSITNLVNDKLIPVAKKHYKKVSAAVFPNGELVRQQWHKWSLDAVFPMLYQKYYDEKADWVKRNTEKGVQSIGNGTDLYSGIFVGNLDSDEFSEAITASREGGAKGIALFTAARMKEAQWQSFAGVMRGK